MLGFGLAAGCMAVAQVDTLSKGARLAISLLLCAVGYVILGVILWAVLRGRVASLPPAPPAAVARVEAQASGACECPGGVGETGAFTRPARLGLNDAKDC